MHQLWLWNLSLPSQFGPNSTMIALRQPRGLVCLFLETMIEGEACLETTPLLSRSSIWKTCRLNLWRNSKRATALKSLFLRSQILTLQRIARLWSRLRLSLWSLANSFFSDRLHSTKHQSGYQSIIPTNCLLTTSHTKRPRKECALAKCDRTRLTVC